MARRAVVSAVFLCTCLCWAKVSLPMPTHYVEDRAGIIDADYEQKLNGLLQELEQKTSAQFIVLTVKSTDGVPIDQYSIELVEQWKLGQKGQDNGLLFTVAYNDRKYRFEVGYGMEGFLTDQYTGRLGRDVLVPAMRQGRVSEGIYQTALALASRIAKEYNVQLSGMPQNYREPIGNAGDVRGKSCCSGCFFLFLMFIFLTAMGRGSFLWPLWFLLGSSYGASRNPYNRNSRGYWGYGGGGFGGGFGGRGGFGGFGGGRGGGFGGGGASGGW